ncbi:PAS domain S-box protein [Chrysiogenes arsenatis]|uniref:PAS domain S-box protein n=1 Tax=Chrysiogenes arsenatis TaxID=309797 RepID=UPI0004291AB1|nr:PAS domain S-box protein [Chrysiogenes arsenatis]
MTPQTTTILLVEDEALIALVQKRVLEKHGYTVLLATSGAKAIEMADSEPSINLILMDIDLGSGIDGTEAAAIILAKHDLPLVFLSSHTAQAIVEKTEKITSYGYIVKGSGDTVLLVSIKMALKLFNAKLESRLHEEKLQASEEQHRRLFETMSQGVIYQSAHGEIISANLAAERILGLTFEQMAGLSSLDPRWKMICEDGSPVAGEDHPAMVSLQTGKKCGPVIRGVFHPERNDYIWLQITATPLFHAGETAPYQVHATFDDITEQRKAEHNYRMLFQEMIDGYAFHEIICDKTGTPIDFRFLDVNPAFEKMVGLPVSHVVGRTVLEIFPETEPFWIETYGRVALTGEPTRFENFFGELGKHFEVAAFSPKQGQFVCTFSDITHRKQSEETLRQQVKEKEILLRETHHRIKNNIASIAALLSLQAEATPNPEVALALNEAISRIKSMSNLYEKMLIADDYNNLYVGDYLENIVKSVIALFAGERMLDVNTQFGNFMLNSKQLLPLGIIVNELLTNAMKYAFVGHRTGKVEVVVTQTENRVTLTLSDNGVGLPEAFDATRNKGFGLVLVDILSQQIGGRFSIIKAEGTRCCLEFPIA